MINYSSVQTKSLSTCAELRIALDTFVVPTNMHSIRELEAEQIGVAVQESDEIPVILELHSIDVPNIVRALVPYPPKRQIPDAKLAMLLRSGKDIKDLFRLKLPLDIHVLGGMYIDIWAWVPLAVVKAPIVTVKLEFG